MATAASAPLLNPSHSALVTTESPPTLLTFAVSSTAVRKHEQIWIAGSEKAGGSPSAGHTVAIERRKGTTAPWERVTTAKTRSNGKYGATFRPTGPYNYPGRVSAKGSSGKASSAPHMVLLDSGNSTLTARKKIVGSRLGATKSGLIKLSSKQRQAAKRPELAPAQYQRFSKGTVYSSSNKTKAYGASACGGAGEVIGTAQSQVGYCHKISNGLVQNSKFNKYMKGDSPWCSFFLS